MRVGKRQTDRKRERERSVCVYEGMRVGKRQTDRQKERERERGRESGPTPLIKCEVPKHKHQYRISRPV